MERLSAEELRELVIRVFQPSPSDTAVAVLVDLPDGKEPRRNEARKREGRNARQARSEEGAYQEVCDRRATPPGGMERPSQRADHDGAATKLADSPAWRERREMAADWAGLLAGERERLGLETHLVLYRNARMNNADLPARAHLHEPGAALPNTADDLQGEGVAMAEVLSAHSILLAPTELSATAPLKLTAGEHGFRAATMPGFSPAMIPALRLDYGEINRRCLLLKGLLDRAVEAAVQFEVHGERHDLLLDLRHRTAHASGGLFPDLGVAGNLPSGETYIVPYEGEVADQPSRTAGVLPVQFDDAEVVLFEVEGNRAVRVRDGEAAAARERIRLQDEPAYGNMAELGLGVLADFGLQPSGDLLLDEKLGLHIAFGRSDHFGGQTGASDFSCAEAVVHIDRVYLPTTQPRVLVPAVDLRLDDGSELPLIRDHAYVIDWG